MKLPPFHRFLGLAGIYVALRAQTNRLDAHGPRIARQEQLMSKTTIAIAALAAGLTSLATAQKKEAVEQKELGERLSAFIGSKSDGDTITQDELDQLTGLGSAVQAAADASERRATDLKGLVDQLPDNDPSTGGDAPTETTPSEPTAPTTDEGGDASPVSEPVSDPVAEPVSDDSTSA